MSCPTFRSLLHFFMIVPVFVCLQSGHVAAQIPNRPHNEHWPGNVGSSNPSQDVIIAISEDSRAIGANASWTAPKTKLSTEQSTALNAAHYQLDPRQTFNGFALYDHAQIKRLSVSDHCAQALARLVMCDRYVDGFRDLSYRGSLGNDAVTDLVCANKCRNSLKVWIANANRHCPSLEVSKGPATAPAWFILQGVEETCLKDPTTGRYCNDIIDGFEIVPSIEKMSREELCSFCYVERIAMMQRSQFSTYEGRAQSQLEYIYTHCDQKGNTTIPPPVYHHDDVACGFNNWLTVPSEMTCDSLALSQNVSSASLLLVNWMRIQSCGVDSPIKAGTKLCLPIPCETYQMTQANHTCSSIELELMKTDHTLKTGFVNDNNPWLDFDCQALNRTRYIYGNTICIGLRSPVDLSTFVRHGAIPVSANEEFVGRATFPPENTEVAHGTTMYCGQWHVAQQGDTCGTICASSYVTSPVFLQVNPSLGDDPMTCTSKLRPGLAYCAGPLPFWDVEWKEEVPSYRISTYGGAAGWKLDNDWLAYDGEFDGSDSWLVAEASTMHAMIHLSNGTNSGDAGFIFRATGMGNGLHNYSGYYFRTGTDRSVVLGRMDAGNWTELTRIMPNKDLYKPHRVKIQATGDDISVDFDHSSALRVTDGTYSGGSLGMRVNGVGARFNSLKIVPVLYDNFSQGIDFGRWWLYDGLWSANNGALEVERSRSGKLIINQTFYDFTLDANVTIHSDGATHGGLMFRSSDIGVGPDAFRGYYAGISGNGQVLLSRVNHSRTELARASVSRAGSQKHHLRLEAAREKLSIFIDNMTHPTIELEDSTFREGGIGARIFHTAATFEYIKLVPMEA